MHLPAAWAAVRFAGTYKQKTRGESAPRVLFYATFAARSSIGSFRPPFSKGGGVEGQSPSALAAASEIPSNSHPKRRKGGVGETLAGQAAPGGGWLVHPVYSKGCRKPSSAGKAARAFGPGGSFFRGRGSDISRAASSSRAGKLTYGAVDGLQLVVQALGGGQGLHAAAAEGGGGPAVGVQRPGASPWGRRAGARCPGAAAWPASAGGSCPGARAT